ncbi:hypothetical protein [Chitinimonas sp. BJB300]|nr:hypothetical protein [Chitinimonas sp. BJB300]
MRCHYLPVVLACSMGLASCSSPPSQNSDSTLLDRHIAFEEALLDNTPWW